MSSPMLTRPGSDPPTCWETMVSATIPIVLMESFTSAITKVPEDNLSNGSRDLNLLDPTATSLKHDEMLKDIEDFDSASLERINRTLQSCPTPEVKLQFLKDLHDVRLYLLRNQELGGMREYRWGCETFCVYRCPRCSLVRRLDTGRRPGDGFCDGCLKYKHDVGGLRLRRRTAKHRPYRHDSQTNKPTSEQPQATSCRSRYKVAVRSAGGRL
jgi:hypothetical protein